MRRILPGYKIAAMDFETDPFKDGRPVWPFCAGFYDGTIYHETWAPYPQCVEQMFEWVASLDQPYLIYLHNGGRFDFHFLFDYVEEPVTIIRNRLVEFSMDVRRGAAHHVFRDSLSIIPVPLDAYRKEKIDYDKFMPRRRERHRARILAYLRSDCVNLWEIATKFHSRFCGSDRELPPLTVGQTAMRELRSLYPFDRASEVTDEIFRPYYFGGRNQCYKSGVIPGPWKVYDVNSCFSAAMRNYDHPIGAEFDDGGDRLPRNRKVFFVDFVGRNRNALPMRIKETVRGDDNRVVSRTYKTDFEVSDGRFFACSHELKLALELGLIEIEKINQVWIPLNTTRFDKFVDHWFSEKVSAKLRGDKAGEMFAKFMLNSCYGKFGQNPRDYKRYALLRDQFADERLRKKGYEPELRLREDLELWSKPATVHRTAFYDVSVAASITSAARSIMLRGIHHARDVIYCDTDSLICAEFDGEVSDTELGAWKWETAKADEKGLEPDDPRVGRPIEAGYCALAGRKTYCLFDFDRGRIRPIKWASKGGDLEPIEIIHLARGGGIEKTQDAPVFSLGKPQKPLKRSFRRTHIEIAETSEVE